MFCQPRSLELTAAYLHLSPLLSAPVSCLFLPLLSSLFSFSFLSSLFFFFLSLILSVVFFLSVSRSPCIAVLVALIALSVSQSVYRTRYISLSLCLSLSLSVSLIVCRTWYIFLSLSLSLSVSLFFVRLSVCPLVCLFFRRYVCLSFCLSICLSVFRFVSLSVCLSCPCLSVSLDLSFFLFVCLSASLSLYFPIAAVCFSRIPNSRRHASLYISTVPPIFLSIPSPVHPITNRFVCNFFFFCLIAAITTVFLIFSALFHLYIWLHDCIVDCIACCLFPSAAFQSNRSLLQQTSEIRCAA